MVRESDRCGRGVAFGDLHVRSVRRGHVTPSDKGMTKEGIIISVVSVSGGSRRQDVVAEEEVCERLLRGF